MPSAGCREGFRGLQRDQTFARYTGTRHWPTTAGPSSHGVRRRCDPTQWHTCPSTSSILADQRNCRAVLRTPGSSREGVPRIRFMSLPLASFQLQELCDASIAALTRHCDDVGLRQAAALGIGQLFQQVGTYDAAIRYFRKALQLSRDRSESRCGWTS